MGDALMGVGTGRGEHRAMEAAQQAISSPLLEEVSIAGARAILINISGGDDLALHDVADATQTIYDEAGEEAEVIFGAVIDPSLNGEIRVTVIATGFNKKAAQHVHSTVQAQPRPMAVAALPRFVEPPRAGVQADLRAFEMAAARSQDNSIRRLTRDINGRAEPLIVGEEFSDDTRFEIPAFLRRQMD
jgi:cell division protein FtsZ